MIADNNTNLSIIFDLDDTLYDYQKCHKIALNRVKQKFVNELDISEKQFVELYVTSRKEVKQTLGKVASSHNKFLYFKKILEKLEFKPYLSIAIDINQLYWQIFYDHMVPNEGVYSLFDTINRLNIPCAILTNFASDIQFKKLIYLGLADNIDYILTSEDVGIEKPDKTAFLLIKEKLNSKHFWMVGDSPKDDLEPSKKYLSAVTFLKKTGVTENKDNFKPDYNFQNFNFIEKKLLKLLKL
jgi:HAD superfamily hydrolase (TIGR01549 family)